MLFIAHKRKRLDSRHTPITLTRICAKSLCAADEKYTFGVHSRNVLSRTDYILNKLFKFIIFEQLLNLGFFNSSIYKSIF